MSTSNDSNTIYPRVSITQSQVIYFAALSAFWLFAYLSTFMQMVSTWFESTTFEHAILIAPITVWLIYRKRYAFGLARTKSSDATFGFSGLVGAITLFVIGKLALVNAVQQFALMSMPLFLVWGMFGLVTMRHLLFPLLFLMLSVPFGEFMIPHLQEVTADLTVMLLTWANVPVYREGWYLQIPEGLFHVAEACSGIRFLFSTITIGLLIVHLEISSKLKQLIFMVCVVIIPIIANGIRAFIMVYIGHVSNMQAAVGFDHLVYGWVFFFIVTALVLMFSRLFYDDKRLPHVGEKTVNLNINRKRLFACFLIVALGPVLMTTYYSQQQSVLANANEQEQTVDKVVSYAGWAPVYSHFDKYDTRLFNADGHSIIFHEITYLTEGEDKELITWSNRPYDPEHWSVAESIESVYNVDGRTVPYTFLQLKNGRGKSISAVYSWKIGDKYSSNPLKVKGLQVLSKLSLNDFGGVALYAASQGIESHERLIQALIKLEEQKSE